jgi:hypothetical protein
MKRKYAITLAVIAAATLAIAALDPDTQAAKELRVFFLKSHGQTIAQLRVASGTLCEFRALDSSGLIEANKTTGIVKASNGVVLKITSGTNSITVTADQVEGRPAAD